MAYATIMEFEVDLDTHIEIGKAFGDEPIKGMIVHAAGTSPNGVYSLDVWETKDDADRFFTDRMLPGLAQLDIAGGPPLSMQEFDLPFVQR
jgi:hypothetical protein